MKPGQLIRTPMLVAVGLFLTFTMRMMAQVQSQTTTTKEPLTRIVEVEKGEVVYVSGHDLILKMENGEYRHFNVPDSATATVDGKQIGIHDVKVGMTLQKTISTTTTPTTITKVDTVTGKVFHVVPPLSVTLTLEDGTNQEFKIPEGQKFDVDGQMVDAFGLREGMKISATKVTETPETIVTQKAKVTGKMPPPPPPNVPILIVFVH
jgi:RNase P/RNase MRP subunit p29